MPRFSQLLVALALALVPHAAAGGGKADPLEIAAHVARLGSKNYADREAASRALDALGEPALDALRTAAERGDPETQRRATRLIRTIGRRAETARLLRQTTVRLDLKDVPAAAAIAELAKRSGFPVGIDKDSPALRDRRVTLQTGDVPFWEALRLLCEKAGLREVSADADRGKPLHPNLGSGVVVMGGGAGPRATDILKPSDWDRPTAILLTDGAPPATAAQVAGAVRIRAVPPDPAARWGGEYNLKLEATAEPAMRWHEALSVRVESAVDDRGQRLKSLPVDVVRPKPPPNPNRGVVIINGQVVSGDDGPKGSHPFFPVRLQAGDLPAKTLKELRGTVAALIFSAPQDLVTVDDILKAEGREARGTRGGAVRVIEVKGLDGGELRVRVAVEAPPREVGDGVGGQPLLNVNIVINGRQLGEKDDVLNASNFVLLDGGGRPLQTVRAVNTGKRSGEAREYELTYRPAAGQAAAHFVYRDRQSAIVEIPFVLRDVPLQQHRGARPPMSLADQPPLRDLPDRVIRDSLKHPENLRALLEQVVPELAPHFDYASLREVSRAFPLDDWRRREADLPFEIPYRLGEEKGVALVRVLIEHQSDTDVMMPLRTLYFAVTYWDKQWYDWERLPPPRPPLRLAPVLPVVLYTGPTPWGSNRTLLGLLGEPAAFHAFAPRWEPLFWNLAERTPQALLESGREWLQVMAVLRAERADATTFEEVFLDAIRRLESVYPKDRPQWYDLMRIVWTWAVWRRPAGERDRLQTVALATQADRQRLEELEAMGKTIADGLVEEGSVKSWREALVTMLRRRFGPLPEALLQSISSIADVEELKSAFDRALDAQRLEDFQP